MKENHYILDYDPLAPYYSTSQRQNWFESFHARVVSLF